MKKNLIKWLGALVVLSVVNAPAVLFILFMATVQTLWMVPVVLIVAFLMSYVALALARIWVLGYSSLADQDFKLTAESLPLMLLVNLAYMFFMAMCFLVVYAAFIQPMLAK